jgi:uncharacterized protein YjbJ (UPF0337 family)
MINTQEIQGQWNQLRGKVKEHWGNLTDDDLQIQNGNVDQLIGQIQHKTGEGREAIERFLGELTQKGSAGIAQAAGAAGQYVQQASEHVREHLGNVSDRLGEGYEQSREMVRNYPTQSVATALGAGLVLGLFVGLALRSR